MDRKTLALLLTELVLVVALVVVIAMDFNSHEPEKLVASHEAALIADAHKDAAAEEAVKEEAHAPAKEEAAEEHAEVKEEKKAEEKKHVKKEEKHAKKPAVKKEDKHAKKPAAKKEEAKSAAKAAAPADVIAMNNPAYAKHKKGIVQFTHKKHIEEYKLNCGECHHDDSGEPLKDLKMGDAVHGCIECHPNPGKAPKAKKDQKVEYHADMLHTNCIGCHKAYDKKNKTKAAPKSCGKCHPKKKK